MRKFAGLFLFFLLLIGFKTTIAQKKIYNYTLTFSPFSIGELDGNVTVGGGFDFGKNFAFYSDFSYIFSNNIGADNREPLNVTGYKIKPAFLVFFDKFKKYKISEGFYGSVELMFKKVNNFREDGFQIFDALGNPVFTINTKYKIIKVVNSASIVLGYRGYFSGKQRLGFNVYAGTGIRFRKIFTKGLPENVTLDNEFFNNKNLLLGPFNANSNMPNAVLGLKLIYRLTGE
jgi:hypothetical protein